MLKESTIHILKEKRDYYKEMYTMCEEALQQDKSMTEICSDSKYCTLSSFRARVLNNEIPNKSFDITQDDLIDITDDLMSPEERIFRDVISDTHRNIDKSYIDFPVDFESTMQDVMEECYEDMRDNEIIRLAYCDELSYQQIAEEIGISIERVRQLIVRFIKKMRRSDRVRRMILGNEEYSIVVESLDKKKEKIIQASSNQFDIKDDISIDFLNLSRRTSNCLKRNDIQTIKQIVELQDSDLMKMRNFGASSLTELREEINKYLKGEYDNE